MIKSGMPYWLFWVMLVVIVFLAAVILIRDKAIREGVLALLFRVRRKIQDTRVRMRISKERERFSALLTELGKKAWGKVPGPAGTGAIGDQLKAVHDDKSDLAGQLDGVQKNMTSGREAFELFRDRQAGAIKEQEALKAPLVEELDRLKGRLKELEKTTGDMARSRAKHEKKAAGLRTRLQEVRTDDSLSKIEKQTQEEQLRRDIEEQDRLARELEHRLKPLEEQQGNPGKEIEKLKPRIDTYNKEISQLKDKLKARQKEYEARRKEHSKQESALESKSKQLERQADILFKQLGEALYKERFPGTDLDPVYAQLDLVEQAVKRMEKQISS
jgi:predicted  nucleic acid-binding Zn-ribbon protein